MILLRDETIIRAPIERCFYLSLSIDLELTCIARYSGRIVAGRQTGLIGPGERVSWRVKQFLLPVRHTSEITLYDPPAFFQDTMIDGVFRTFQHDHFFDALEPNLTRMRDEMRIRAPLGILGRIAETTLVQPRMQKLLANRNETIQRVSESSDWRNYLPS